MKYVVALLLLYVFCVSLTVEGFDYSDIYGLGLW